MLQPELPPEMTWSEIVVEEQKRLRLNRKFTKELSDWFAEHAITPGDKKTHESAYALEAAERLAHFDRLQILLGLLAPGGTAPRTALEELHRQSAGNVDESQVVLDLRQMLSEHWADWTPALREIEGFPPIPSSDN